VIIEDTPLSDTIIVSAESNKTSITAGNTDPAANAETLQFSAIQNGNNITSEVTWSISANSSFSAGTSIAGIATISGSGLLTAGTDLTENAEVWVFAAKDGKQSDGYKVEIKKWAEPSEPTGSVIWNFSDAEFSSLTTTDSTAPLIVRGLIIASDQQRISATANAPAIPAFNLPQYNWTLAISTRGAATATTRHIVVPLLGPGTVTAYAVSNSGTATTMIVTDSAASTVNLHPTAFPLAGWSSGIAITPARFTSTTNGEHVVVLKPAASARIFLVRVDYD
jgi:hypothetical protein